MNVMWRGFRLGLNSLAMHGTGVHGSFVEKSHCVTVMSFMSLFNAAILAYAPRALWLRLPSEKTKAERHKHAQTNLITRLTSFQAMFRPNTGTCIRLLP